MSRDTSVAAQRRQDDAVRALSPDARIELAVQASLAARQVVEEGIRARHPDYDDRQVVLTGARLRLGDELFRSAFPAEPLLPA